MENATDKGWPWASIGFFVLGILIIVSWVSVWIFLPMYYPDKAAAGQLGDSFGVANSLFGGMTLLGVFYAAYLQRQALERAEDEAHKIESERLKSLQLQSDLAKAMLATAELAALEGVVEYYNQRATPDTKDKSISVHFYLDEGNPLVKRDRYQQLIRSKLAELRSPAFDWKKVPPEQRTWARQHYLTLMRDRRDRCQVISQRPEDPWGTSEGVRDLLMELRHEIWLLGGQEGVAASSDRLILDGAYGLLDPIVNELAKKLIVDRGYEITEEDWRKIHEFFEYRESS